VGYKVGMMCGTIVSRTRVQDCDLVVMYDVMVRVGKEDVR